MLYRDGAKHVLMYSKVARRTRTAGGWNNQRQGKAQYGRRGSPAAKQSQRKHLQTHKRKMTTNKKKDKEKVKNKNITDKKNKKKKKMTNKSQKRTKKKKMKMLVSR